MANVDPVHHHPSLLGMARNFFHMEAAGGILLVIAAALALIVANSPLQESYDYLLNQMSFTIGFSDPQGEGLYLTKSVLLWINDGLMAVFFFLVGLEIKREVMRGELSSKEQALLPALAAIGGMVVPALVYAYINKDSPDTMHGWAIPSATDIAFSLGVLALLGSRAPLMLKVLLTAIAVIDDLGAILIIAFFYSSEIHMVPLYVAGFSVVALIMMNRGRVSRIAPFILVGFVMWVAMLKSGIHPTIAGVLTALCIPMSCTRHPERRPLEHLEHYLHPWVAYLILPLFAFSNAGVPFKGMSFESFTHPVALGITAGLFFGKVMGIFGIIFIAVKIRLCRMPKDITWYHIWGIAHLCGIGFTMSLFIGELALQGGESQADIRIGVLTGSILSAVAAYTILRLKGAAKA
jgi:NhaA family Na+:H+ antiporter